jgi:polygalacturonase
MKKTGKIAFIISLFLFSINGFSQSVGVWDVYSFGAKGDGKTSDTQAIQAAIDNCYRAGGGKVSLYNGRFLSGTIYLKSCVTLHIESGATLLGSNSPDDFPAIVTDYPVVSGEYPIDKALIYAERSENIAITGFGTIDGRGDDLEPMERPRPHIIVFRSCKNIKVRNVRLYNAAFWVQKYQSCDNMVIDGVTVDSRENKDIEKPRFIDVPGGRNTDGCNIVDCKNVRISNCNINSGDDGIVFKSFLRNEGCYNVTVNNCIITTNASGIKIGTESAGTFKDFTINNCVIYDTRGAAIGLMTVDGASVERIIISNITLRNIKGTAIFLRLGNRGRIYQNGDEKAAIGKMNDILIQNVYGKEIERYGCSITGIQDAPIENIVLDNIQLTFTGSNTPLLFEGYDDKIVEELTMDIVPEKEDVYPRGEMFGKLPAYGFYVRHINNMEFNGIRLRVQEDDKRPALVADDVKGLTINRFSTKVSSDISALIYLCDVEKVNIFQSPDILPVSVFKTKDIILPESENPVSRSNP